MIEFVIVLALIVLSYFTGQNSEKAKQLETHIENITRAKEVKHSLSDPSTTDRLWDELKK